MRANARWVPRSVVDFGEVFGGPARGYQRVGRRSASGGQLVQLLPGADAPAGGGPQGGTVGGIASRNKEGVDDRTAAGDRVELQPGRGC